MAKYNHVDLPKRNATGKPKNKILSVTIYRTADYDGMLSSDLGTYSTKPDGPYSIDRRHTAECASVEPQASDVRAKLDRILGHTAPFFTLPNEYAPGEEDTINCLEQCREDATECDCGGLFVDRNSCEYFNPCASNYEGDTPENIRKYCRQDFERVERYEGGYWHYLGVTAKAEIGIPQGGSSYLLQTIQSGGLWGIESDSEEGYIAGEEKEQLAELREVLISFGFSRRAIAAAFKTVKHKEN